MFEHEIDTVVMGSDWEESPRFEYLREHCEVTYLSRTEGTSTSQIRKDLLFEVIEYKRQDEQRHHLPLVPNTSRLRSLGTEPETKLPPPPKHEASPFAPHPGLRQLATGRQSQGVLPNSCVNLVSFCACGSRCGMQDRYQEPPGWEDTGERQSWKPQ